MKAKTLQEFDNKVKDLAASLASTVESFTGYYVETKKIQNGVAELKLYAKDNMFSNVIIGFFISFLKKHKIRPEFGVGYDIDDRIEIYIRIYREN